MKPQVSPFTFSQNVPRLMKTLFFFSTLLMASACGSKESNPAPAQNNLPEVGSSQNGVVIKSQALINLTTDAPSLAQHLFRAFWSVAYAASGSTTVTVVNAPNTTMTLDTSAWNPPTIKNAVLDFGYLTISSLFDNNLNVCGPSGNSKCKNAVVQIYSTGPAGAGMWNSVDAYGAPITAGLDSSTPSSVNLNVANAATLETTPIAANLHVWSNTGFLPAPRYDVKVDFSNAGAGSYTTTLVIQYGLSQ